MLRTRKRQPIPPSQAHALLRSHQQAFLAIQAVRLLVIEHEPLPTQQDMQTQVAITAMLPGQPPEPLSQSLISRFATAITRYGSVEVHHLAGATLTDALLGDQLGYNCP